MSLKSKAVEDEFLLTIRKRIDRAIGRATRWCLFHNSPIEPNKVVFMTYKNAYECNPKYIAEEILRRDLGWDLVWVVPKKLAFDQDQFPEEIRVVRREQLEFYTELASARFWVDNSLNCMWQPFPKKKGQCYIETWHGSMGLKRVGRDDVGDPRWRRTAEHMDAVTDICISDSTFETNVYRETWWPTAEVREFGHARNDMLLHVDDEKRRALREKVADELGFDVDDKIVLYAPTFRDSGTMKCYDIDYKRLLASLQSRFGGTWKVLVRLHFHNRRSRTAQDVDEGIISATDYLDMQELLAVADAGITDYSSWCCDYALTGKPCFIYATDLAEYNTERGLYYPLEETPFPIATNNDELMKAIEEFDDEEFERKRVDFLNARGCKEDGHAAERIVDMMCQMVEGR